MLSTAIGALIGGAIDSASGDDSAADGAIIGGATAMFVRAIVPFAATYAVGWGVLKGLEKAKNTVFSEGVVK
ncbi:hypothetical protein M9980_09440 [Sphingomonas donggukensis]|uniref:Uncharacterized protein n=1 Tax=Sphingomonas donggukensis TaxID=2949093 RepID=A0ABY4TW86_9SPHN|nr:hypothetical protein [Sphingomonas donggukensis]URW74796.1 hypothetical protein M9980_09440 [Sphingomonas donggukensis]